MIIIYIFSIFPFLFLKSLEINLDDGNIQEATDDLNGGDRSGRSKSSGTSISFRELRPCWTLLRTIVLWTLILHFERRT